MFQRILCNVGIEYSNYDALLLVYSYMMDTVQCIAYDMLMMMMGIYVLENFVLLVAPAARSGVSADLRKAPGIQWLSAGVVMPRQPPTRVPSPPAMDDDPNSGMCAAVCAKR